MSCYSLLQHSRLAWLELFVDHTHTHSMNNLRWQPHWLPRLTSFPRMSRDWCDGEPETAVSASLQKIKLIKNQQTFFNFIKSQTCECDSFVNHFDGHFAYLKTLDFSFNFKLHWVVSSSFSDSIWDWISLILSPIVQFCHQYWRTTLDTCYTTITSKQLSSFMSLVIW